MPPIMASAPVPGSGIVAVLTVFSVAIGRVPGWMSGGPPADAAREGR
jgi:hypothetical protein